MSPNKAMSLQQWQHALAAVSEGDAGVTANIKQWINHSGAIEKRLQAYRNNSLGAQCSAMEQTFPRLLKLLGQDYFRQCLRDFFSGNGENNTQTADLNRIGKTFPHYLMALQIERVELGGYPWLADLAQLEYQVHSAYYASNNNNFDFSEFQQHAHQPEILALNLDASIAIHHSFWPLSDIIQHIDGNQIDDYQSQEKFYCVSRQSFEVIIQPIIAQEYQLLKAIMMGQTLLQLSQQCSDCQSLLPVLFSRGWVDSFSVLNNANAIRVIAQRPTYV